MAANTATFPRVVNGGEDFEHRDSEYCYFKIELRPGSYTAPGVILFNSRHELPIGLEDLLTGSTEVPCPDKVDITKIRQSWTNFCNLFLLGIAIARIIEGLGDALKSFALPKLKKVLGPSASIDLSSQTLLESIGTERLNYLATLLSGFQIAGYTIASPLLDDILEYYFPAGRDKLRMYTRAGQALLDDCYRLFETTGHPSLSTYIRDHKELRQGSWILFTRPDDSKSLQLAVSVQEAEHAASRALKDTSNEPDCWVELSVYPEQRPPTPRPTPALYQYRIHSTTEISLHHQSHSPHHVQPPRWTDPSYKPPRSSIQSTAVGAQRYLDSIVQQQSEYGKHGPSHNSLQRLSSAPEEARQTRGSLIARVHTWLAGLEEDE